MSFGDFDRQFEHLLRDKGMWPGTAYDIIEVTERDSGRYPAIASGVYVARPLGCDGPAPIYDCTQLPDGAWAHDDSAELSELLRV